MIEEYSSPDYPHHRYIVRFRTIWTPNAHVDEIMAWCYERWGNPFSSAFSADGTSEQALESRWVVFVTTIRVRTYEDAFDYQIRWGGTC